jgi:hypothetical protein
VPAAQAVGDVQLRQGATPVAFQLTPATHGSWHVLDCVFQV